MKNIIILLLLCVPMQSVTASVTFTKDIDIYSVYNEDVVDIVFSITVNLYEPGYLSNVYMNGDIGQTLNVYGGGIGSLNATNNSTVNLFGGTFDVSIALQANAKCNVYGYGFDYNPDIGCLSGFWENDAPFVIYMNPFNLNEPNYNITWSRMVLHEVPEPAAIFLFGVAIPFMLKRRRIHV